jgi:ProP effector
MSKATRAAHAAALALLADRFPHVFAVDPKLRKPLKVGIADDLAAALDGVISRRQLAFALAAYCDSVSYLMNCTLGAERVDLNSNAAGTVTAAEAAYAARRLAEPEARKATTVAAPQGPPPAQQQAKLSLADLKIAAQIRKEAASS